MTDERTAAMDALIAESADMIDAPVIYMQWNDGWQVWEQVVPEAAGRDGVVAFVRQSDRTTAEQRGYDRAIAEVVAWLREEAAMRHRLANESREKGARIYNETRGMALDMATDAIEAGEHKP